MGKLIDLTGQRFGRLVVIERAPQKEISDQHVYWRCLCDCGNVIETSGVRLRKGNVQSCGCFRKEKMSQVSIASNTRHGISCTKLYKVFYGMRDRCYNPQNKRFKDYGGRGITICQEWLHDVQTFYDWSISHGYQEGLTIDRIDNDKGYSPDNCRWATHAVQNSNRRPQRRKGTAE